MKSITIPINSETASLVGEYLRSQFFEHDGSRYVDGVEARPDEEIYNALTDNQYIRRSCIKIVDNHTVECHFNILSEDHQQDYLLNLEFCLDNGSKLLYLGGRVWRYVDTVPEQ